MKKIITLLAIISFITTSAQVCFTSTTYSPGGRSIVNADFNNDGKIDLATSYSDSIKIIYGDGFGNFTTQSIFHVSLSNGNGTIVSADFNKDGNVDLAISAQSSVLMLLNTGSGSFSPASPFTVGLGPWGIIASDFNGDGNPDIATTNLGSNNLSVLLGDGTGNLGTHTDYTVGPYISEVASGDFNGDGKADLATGFNVGGVGQGEIALMFGDGIGNFGAPINITDAGYDAYSLFFADFNADGKQDIATATGNSNVVTILYGNGTGGVDTIITVPVGIQCVSILSADFNGDSKLDIAVGNENANNVSVLLGNGVHSFGVATNFSDPYVPQIITSADFNADGKPDLAVGNQQGNNMMVFLNAAAPNLSLVSSHASALCAGASSTLTVSGATTYTWSLNTGISNPNYTVTTAIVTPSVNSTYSVIAQTNGCKDSASVSFTIIMPQTPNICMVTTDSATNYFYNIVYWDKTPYSNVDSFIVYRKDALSSSYLRIGATSKDSLSRFIDTAFSIGGPNGGNPQYSSWSYKLAIKDTCGNIGSQSPYHQTMF